MENGKKNWCSCHHKVSLFKRGNCLRSLWWCGNTISRECPCIHKSHILNKKIQAWSRQRWRWPQVRTFANCCNHENYLHCSSYIYDSLVNIMLSDSIYIWHNTWASRHKPDLRTRIFKGFCNVSPLPFDSWTKTRQLHRVQWQSWTV